MYVYLNVDQTARLNIAVLASNLVLIHSVMSKVWLERAASLGQAILQQWGDLLQLAVRDTRISNQFVTTRALRFAQPRCTTTPTVLSTKRNYHIGLQSII